MLSISIYFNGSSVSQVTIYGIESQGDVMGDQSEDVTVDKSVNVMVAKAMYRIEPPELEKCSSFDAYIQSRKKCGNLGT